MDLGQTKKVTGVVIQGCPDNNYWVTKFKLQHSMDGSSWTAYTADGEVRECAPWFPKHPKFPFFMVQVVKVDGSLSLWIPLLSSFYQAPQTKTLQTPSCWEHLCRPGSSASSLWTSAVRSACALTSWAAYQTVGIFGLSFLGWQYQKYNI